jgi:hypothetical protein
VAGKEECGAAHKAKVLAANFKQANKSQIKRKVN